ncbi:MAG: hypothetical protein ACI4SG_02025 [Oligosphaeraceae bacterium]
MKLADSQNHALLEVSVTLHPEAIRQSLTGRAGCLWGFLRMAGFLVLLYFFLGWELVAGRFFPELHLHPLPLLLAYLALRAPMGLPMILAWLAGVLLDCGMALPPGVHALALTLSTGGVAVLAISPLFPVNPRGWYAAALAGGAAHLLYALVEIALCGTWSRAPGALGMGTLLAAFGYSPTLSWILDRFSAEGQTT